MPPRPPYSWRLRTRTLALGERTLLMGIVNITPDSFSDGGLFFFPEAAVPHALRLLEEGADVLDLGAESTRPNATPISSEEEQARLLPVLEGILRERPEAILSVDTYHAETAKAALDAGAEIVNDVSGLLWDEAMAATLAANPCGAILMHTRGRPHEWRSLPTLPADAVLQTVLEGLRQTLARADHAGIVHETLVLDPGFGFGKRGDENLTLLAQFADLHQLSLPLLAGISRKRFLTAHMLEPTLEAREHATTAAHTVAVLAGAHILRTHNIASARAALKIADRLLAKGS